MLCALAVDLICALSYFLFVHVNFSGFLCKDNIEYFPNIIAWKLFKFGVNTQINKEIEFNFLKLFY